jgi:hypothetical protein
MYNVLMYTIYYILYTIDYRLIDSIDYILYINDYIYYIYIYTCLASYLVFVTTTLRLFMFIYLLGSPVAPAR